MKAYNMKRNKFNIFLNFFFEIKYNTKQKERNDIVCRKQIWNLIMKVK